MMAWPNLSTMLSCSTEYSSAAREECCAYLCQHHLPVRHSFERDSRIRRLVKGHQITVWRDVARSELAIVFFLESRGYLHRSIHHLDTALLKADWIQICQV